MNPTQDEQPLTGTNPSIPAKKEMPARKVKMGPGDYQEVPANYPNRAEVRAITKGKKGYKRDKPFKGARDVRVK
jgi:hypothetical protein